MRQVSKLFTVFVIPYGLVLGVLSTAAAATDLPRGSLIEAKKIADRHWSKRAINLAKAQMRLNAQEFPTLSPVDTYRVSFQTKNHKQAPHVSSGLLFVPPEISRPLPILVYQHATRLTPKEAPSFQRFDPEAQILSLLFASECCIVVMPDNIGLEQGSPFPQFYLNAEIQASVALDLLLASRQFLGQSNIAYTDDILISGYSQGAHNALAFQKYLQENPQPKVRVLGSSVMSGPYAITEIARAVLRFDSKTRIDPVFLSLAILGMHEAYDTFPRFEEILAEPYSKTLPSVLRRGVFKEIASELPKDIKKLFNLPYVLGVALAGDEHPFWKALALNDVDNFTPTAPVLMIHSPTDNVVPFWEAEKTFGKLKARGADIRFMELDKKWDDHTEAAYPAFIESARHFKKLIP